jgi:hypothetical protein
MSSAAVGSEPIPQRIFLCFLTSDLAEINLALEYWAVDSEGRWLTTVQAISESLGKPKHKITESIRRIAIAHDMRLRCSNCRGPRALTSRTDMGMSGWYTSSGFLCDDCRDRREQERRDAEDMKRRTAQERSAKIIETNAGREMAFDYDSISYLDAILAYAVMLYSDSAVTNGLVGNPAQLALCGDSLLSKLLDRLFDAGILTMSADTPHDAIQPSEGGNTEQFSYYPLKVKWQFAQSESGESFSEIFRQLGFTVDTRAEHPEYIEAFSELWWMLALDSSVQYLREELDKYYGLSDFTVGEKMNEALAYALSRFSIPKLRYLLYRIAKNTAALSSRRDFNRRHALNTIPGSLIRDCDRALADHWDVKPFCFKWDQEEARLITILFDRVLTTGIEGFKVTTGTTFEQFVDKGFNSTNASV